MIRRALRLPDQCARSGLPAALQPSDHGFLLIVLLELEHLEVALEAVIFDEVLALEGVMSERLISARVNLNGSDMVAMVGGRLLEEVENASRPLPGENVGW